MRTFKIGLVMLAMVSLIGLVVFILAKWPGWCALISVGGLVTFYVYRAAASIVDIWDCKS